MMKASRWLSLMLVLALFLSVGACAEAEGQVPMDSLDVNTWNAWLMAADTDSADVIGKKAETNTNNVWIRKEPSVFCYEYTALEHQGTQVTIIGFVPYQFLLGEFYEVEYIDADGTVITGYTETRQLTIVEEEIPEITVDPWTPEMESYTMGGIVEGATGYIWKRALVTADGTQEWVVIEGETGPTLTIDTTTREALKYAYRCTAMKGEEAILQENNEPINPVREEIALWLDDSVTNEMLARAVAADSLDSVVVEGGELYHVREGEVYATIDENNVVTHSALGVAFGVYDAETNTIRPLSEPGAQAEDENFTGE